MSLLESHKRAGAQLYPLAPHSTRVQEVSPAEESWD